LKEAETAFETLEIHFVLTCLILERTSFDTVGVYLMRDFEKILAFLALRRVWTMRTRNVFMMLCMYV
jgi:hypothetical protein